MIYPNPYRKIFDGAAQVFEVYSVGMGSKDPTLYRFAVIKKNVIPRFSWELIPNLSHNDNSLPAKLPDTLNKAISYLYL